ncbi:hypothetical protein [Solimicrobium silvestre]|nr:hypothetical protein [Solimicrobium silvestre]
MNTATLNIPTGAALEREIDNAEAQLHDELIRKTISERMAIANDQQTVFVTHENAFTASQARLLSKLAGNFNAK